MGSAKRLRKLYEKPLRIWDKARIGEEGKLVEQYGLRNARELWRAQTLLRKIRREARAILSGRGTGIDARTEQLLNRVRTMFVRGEATLDGILSLKTSDVLERRLQTIVVRRGLASTMTQARQFITHGHIGVDGRKATSPSHIVSFVEEAGVTWYGRPLQAAKPAEAEEPADEASEAKAAPEKKADAATEKEKGKEAVEA